MDITAVQGLSNNSLRTFNKHLVFLDTKVSYATDNFFIKIQKCWQIESHIFSFINQNNFKQIYTLKICDYLWKSVTYKSVKYFTGMMREMNEPSRAITKRKLQVEYLAFLNSTIYLYKESFVHFSVEYLVTKEKYKTVYAHWAHVFAVCIGDLFRYVADISAHGDLYESISYYWYHEAVRWDCYLVKPFNQLRMIANNHKNVIATFFFQSKIYALTNVELGSTCHKELLNMLCASTIEKFSTWKSSKLKLEYLPTVVDPETFKMKMYWKFNLGGIFHTSCLREDDSVDHNEETLHKAREFFGQKLILDILIPRAGDIDGLLKYEREVCIAHFKILAKNDLNVACNVYFTLFLYTHNFIFQGITCNKIMDNFETWEILFKDILSSSDFDNIFTFFHLMLQSYVTIFSLCEMFKKIESDNTDALIESSLFKLTIDFFCCHASILMDFINSNIEDKSSKKCSILCSISLLFSFLSKFFNSLFTSKIRKAFVEFMLQSLHGNQFLQEFTILRNNFKQYKNVKMDKEVYKEMKFNFCYYFPLKNNKKNRHNVQSCLIGREYKSAISILVFNLTKLSQRLQKFVSFKYPEAPLNGLLVKSQMLNNQWDVNLRKISSFIIKPEAPEIYSDPRTEEIRPKYVFVDTNILFRTSSLILLLNIFERDFFHLLIPLKVMRELKGNSKSSEEAKESLETLKEYMHSYSRYYKMGIKKSSLKLVRNNGSYVNCKTNKYYEKSVLENSDSDIIMHTKNFVIRQAPKLFFKDGKGREIALYTTIILSNDKIFRAKSFLEDIPSVSLESFVALLGINTHLI